MQRGSRLVVTATLLAILAGGCAVLTQSQVDAVADFADTTKDFGDTPGAVIRAHGELRRERGLLEAASRTDPTAAAGDLDQSLAAERGLAKLADRTSLALNVLDEYAEMLGVLSSSKFTDELQNNAVALGKSIDKDITTLNAMGGAHIDQFGDVVAGIVRAAGGIWIRHEQYRALKTAVTSAQKPVQQLTQEVENLMQEYIGAATPETSANIFANETKKLEKILNRPSARPWGVDGLARFQGALALSHHGEELARSCQKSARAYRDAHDKLVTAMTHKSTDVGDVIASIRALAAEVQAGKRVRNEVKEARSS
jgi:hypothetical protein